VWFVLKKRIDWAVYFEYLTDKEKRRKINEIMELEEGIAMASEVLITISKNEIERARLLSEMKYELDMQSKLAYIEQKEQEFEQKEQEFEQKELEIEQKELEFEQKELEIEQKELEFEQKELEIEQSKLEIKRKEQEFDRKEQEFEQAKQAIHVKEREDIARKMKNLGMSAEQIMEVTGFRL